MVFPAAPDLRAHGTHVGERQQVQVAKRLERPHRAHEFDDEVRVFDVTVLRQHRHRQVVAHEELEGGAVVSERVDDLPGFAGRPMQRADVEAKFQRITKSIVTDAQMARIAQAVWDIDRNQSVRALIDSLAILA